MIMTRGGVTADFKSFLMSCCAARLSLRRWTKTSRTKPFRSAARHSQYSSPAIEMTHLIHMPFVAANRRALSDLIGERLADFFSHSRTVSFITQIPRATSISSTMRRLKGNRKYSQTA